MRTEPLSHPYRAPALLAVIVCSILSICSCVPKAKPAPEEGAGGVAIDPVSGLPNPIDLATKPLPPEEAKALLGDLAGNWFYGAGVGEAAVSASAIVLFPPYALYLLGNSILSMSGYEPLYVTNALPEEQKRAFDSAYADITSAPGRLNAAIAGKEFRTPERIGEDLKKYTNAPK